MDTIDVVERAVTEHSTVWAAYAKSLHRKIAKLRKANRELGASYRKLAEREKALTEALKELLSDIEGLSHEFSICREIAESSYTDKARAALALHKEDA